MRTRFTVSALLAGAAVIAAVIAVAVIRTAPVPVPRAHASAVSRITPASCPAVLRAVNDVARKAHINLATGSMAAHVIRSEELAWSGELLGSWKPSANPTAADVRLGEDVLSAGTGVPLRDNADAAKFIAALQKLQADCG